MASRLQWALAASLAAAPAPAFAVEAVATIPAAHAILSGITGDTAEANLLIQGGASPHTYSLKPSDAASLAEANLVVWVGPGIETFLDGKLGTLAPSARVVTWSKVDGVTQRNYGEAHEKHDDHDHEGHDDHEHDYDGHDHDGHDHEAHDHEGHDHEEDHGHDHDHSGLDPHVWLDPHNAVALSAALAEALAETDPANAEVYAANHAAQKERIKALDAELEAQLASVSGKPYFVFHDAYTHFEDRYDLKGLGAIAISPEIPPGAGRLGEIRERIEHESAVCVFAEPQFRPEIVDTVIEGTGARAAVLDPVGADLEPGVDLYPALLRNMAGSLVECLSGGN